MFPSADEKQENVRTAARHLDVRSLRRPSLSSANDARDILQGNSACLFLCANVREAMSRKNAGSITLLAILKHYRREGLWYSLSLVFVFLVFPLSPKLKRGDWAYRSTFPTKVVIVIYFRGHFC